MILAHRLPAVCAALAAGLVMARLTLVAWAAPAGGVFTFPGPAPCDTTLQACIDGAFPNDLINLSAGTIVTTAQIDKPLRLIGAGVGTTILKAPNGQRALHITGVSVGASAIISGFTIQGGSLEFGDGAAVLVDGSARPTLQNLAILSGTVQDGIAVGGGLATRSSLTLTNVIFQGNTALNGHGGGLAGGPGAHLTLSQVSFINNTASQSGGGLYADSAAISGSTFISNLAGLPGFGGGAYLSGTVTLTNSTLTRNQAHETGGGLFAGGSVTLVGGEFRSNISQQENGGALGLSGNLLLNGTVISDNQSLDSGGAILVTGTTTLNQALLANNRTISGSGGALRGIGAIVINDSQFISNSAYNPGGGLRASVGVTVSNSTFMSNTSGLGGGASEGGGLRANGAATISGGSFVGNSADRGGGAQVGGTLFLAETAFSGNIAALEGGALLVVTATVQDAAFDHNTVTAGNGGAIAASKVLTLTGSTFTANRVLSGTAVANTGTGGGVFGDGSINSIGNTFIGNFAFRLGGGMDADLLASTNDQFRGNLTGPLGSGGGLFVASAFEIKSDQFVTNTANTGGGMGINSTATGSVVNSLFARNIVTFTEGGSAMRVLATSDVVLLHNTFVGTNASSRSAIHMQSPTGDFSIFANVFANLARGLVNFGSVPTSTATTDHNVFFSVTLPYVGVNGFNPGASDITGTVLFLDPAADDYHLLPGSVAIDHAPSYGLSTDFEDQPRPLGANYDSGFDEVLAVELAITKTDGLVSVDAGAPLTYTIVVTNAGENEAFGVLVTDNLPPALIGAAWTCLDSAGSFCNDNGSGSISEFVTVAAGGALTFTVHATVAGSASGILANTATLTLPEGTVNTGALQPSATDTTAINSGPVFIQSLPAVYK